MRYRRRSGAIVAALFLFLLSAPVVHGAPIEISSGNLEGRPFHDLAFLISGYGISLFGAETFPTNIGAELATGHLSETIWTFGLNGQQVNSQFLFMNFELSFEPIPLLSFGDSVTVPFTMTGVLFAPADPSIPAIDFVGHGNLTTGVFPREDPVFTGQFINAKFVPEPSSLVLLALGSVVGGACLACLSSQS